MKVVEQPYGQKCKLAPLGKKNLKKMLVCEPSSKALFPCRR